MKSILMCSPGRCGHHWVADVLGNLLPLKKVKTRRREEFEVVPEGAIMLTHDPLTYFPYICREFKTIAIVRDPRDVVVSAAYYWMTKPPKDYVVLQRFWGLDEMPEDMDFAKMLALLKERGHNPLWWEMYADLGHQMPHILVHYEHMWHRPVETVRSIMYMMGVSVSSDEEIQVALDDQYQHRFLSRGRQRGEEDVTDHYRKGVVGDWRNYFTDEENATFCQRWARVMAILCYAEDGWARS